MTLALAYCATGNFTGLPSAGGVRIGVDRRWNSYSDALQDERGRGGQARERPDAWSLTVVSSQVYRGRSDRFGEADVLVAGRPPPTRQQGQG